MKEIAMHWILTGMALLLALAIMAIGSQYLLRPTIMMGSFGLPLPDSGANTASWLRLKGVRDVTAGVVVLALLAWGTPREVGLILLVEAMIPLGDMLVILAGKGSTKTAFGVHGLTAVVMVLTAIPMMMDLR
jgi:hypothetical protein